MDRSTAFAALDAMPLKTVEKQYRAALAAAKAKDMKDDALNSVYFSKLFLFETKTHRVKKGFGV